MKRIAICTPVLAYGDAVSNDVLGMYKVFNSLGYETNIFVSSSDITEVETSNIDLMRGYIRPSDILIYHHSIGWDKGLDLLFNLNCVKIIKYHNITPPDFFYGIDDSYADVCISGRRQIRYIADSNINLYLSDSSFNMNELVASGAESSSNFVIPPFNNIELLEKNNINFNIFNRYNDGKVNVLIVGRIVPNKCYQNLIDSFFLYNKLYNLNSRLIIVGSIDSRLNVYSRYLLRKIKNYGLKNKVIFTGKVSDIDLKTYYLVSKVFTIISKHEGFCVPLVEAMAMKIPIVACDSGAISETVADAGLVWKEEDPYLIAASINKITSNNDVYYYLGEMGWRRYQNNFTNEKIREEFLKVINVLL